MTFVIMAIGEEELKILGRIKIYNVNLPIWLEERELTIVLVRLSSNVQFKTWFVIHHFSFLSSNWSIFKFPRNIKYKLGILKNFVLRKRIIRILLIGVSVLSWTCITSIVDKGLRFYTYIKCYETLKLSPGQTCFTWCTYQK